MEKGRECERSTMAVASFPGLPSPFFHTASHQKLKQGKTWEQGKHAYKREEKGEWGGGGKQRMGKKLYLGGTMYQETAKTFQEVVFPSAHESTSAAKLSNHQSSDERRSSCKRRSCSSPPHPPHTLSTHPRR